MLLKLPKTETKMNLKLCAHAATTTYSKKEQKALEELKHGEDIFIRNTDNESQYSCLM